MADDLDNCPYPELVEAARASQRAAALDALFSPPKNAPALPAAPGPAPLQHATLPIPAPPTPEQVAVAQAREQVLDRSLWKTLDYDERQALCDRAQLRPDEPNKRRFELAKSQFPRGMRVEGTQEHRDFRNFEQQMNEERKKLLSAGLFEARNAHWNNVAMAREMAGWGPAGDAAVLALGRAPSVGETREQRIERHVREGTRIPDPYEGDRSREYAHTRRTIKLDNQEIARRQRLAAREGKLADREDERQLTRLEKIVAQAPDPTNAAEVAEDLRRQKSVDRYAKSWADRAVDDIGTMVNLGRPIPRASSHPCGNEFRWRCPRFKQFDDKRIPPLPLRVRD